MHDRQLLQKKAFSQSASTPICSQFQTRLFEHGISARQPGLTTVNQFGSQPFTVQTQTDSSLQIQPKLTIGQPGDRYEQEADKMAEQVMRMEVPNHQPSELQREPEAGQLYQTNPLIDLARRGLFQRQALVSSQQKGEWQAQYERAQRFGHSLSRISTHQPQTQLDTQEAVQRKCDVCEQEDAVPSKPSLQPRVADDVQASSDIESQLSQSKGGGSPLSEEVRSFMEPRFGTDFSQVRVHTDSLAIQMNQKLSAQAFTHGRDIYFGAGRTPEKDALTAHELTHVVQQNGSSQLQCQTGDTPTIQKISWEGAESEAACAVLSDEQIYQLFVEVYFSSQPNARAHLVHYRYGGGSVYQENVAAMFTANPRIRTRIAQLIEQQIADGTATTRGSLVGRGVDDNATPPIRQSDYDSEDWRNANGNIDQVDWEIIGSYNSNDYNQVQITVTDPYEWHPLEGRPTQCLHEAFERLKTKGAANYITQGTAVLILPPTQQSPDVPLQSDW